MRPCTSSTRWRNPAGCRYGGEAVAWCTGDGGLEGDGLVKVIGKPQEVGAAAGHEGKRSVFCGSHSESGSWVYSMGCARRAAAVAAAAAATALAHAGSGSSYRSAAARCWHSRSADTWAPGSAQLTALLPHRPAGMRTRLQQCGQKAAQQWLPVGEVQQIDSSAVGRLGTQHCEQYRLLSAAVQSSSVARRAPGGKGRQAFRHAQSGVWGCAWLLVAKIVSFPDVRLARLLKWQETAVAVTAAAASACLS